ncbi:MAG: ScyD/ScyE family protein [Ignavibacteriaceae bacterium]|nr:ScyD/ScyE family protein [Ignavibacteriaceae bacterium]
MGRRTRNRKRKYGEGFNGYTEWSGIYFLNDLPSTAPAFEPVGAQDVCFDIDGKLLVIISNDAGSDSLCGRVLFVDTTGFIPGATPFNRNNIVSSFDMGSIFPGNNPFKVTLGPDNDLFVVDASANAIARWNRGNGSLSSFTTFPPIGQSEAVPTGIIYTGSNFYVGTLTGLPIPIGAAKIYNVDLSGNKTVYQDGLTAIVDIAISPIDGAMYAIQHAEFGPPWLNNKGRLFRIQNGVVDTLLSEMPRPSGMVFNSSGDLFISSFSDDNIVKVSNLPVGVEDENNFVADDFSLEQNYPNPFNPSTTIRYSIANVIAIRQLPEKQSQLVTLKVYDVLGNEVATLVNEEKPAGTYEVKFDAIELWGGGTTSGIYFYKLSAGSLVETRKMILMK